MIVHHLNQIPSILTPSQVQGLSPFRSRLRLLITKRMVSYSICLTFKFVTHVLIIGWRIYKHLTRSFLFIFHRLDEMRGQLKTHSWTEPTRIPTFFPFEDNPLANQAYHLGIAIISLLFGLIHCLAFSLRKQKD